jgi:hypothetical protein
MAQHHLSFMRSCDDRLVINRAALEAAWLDLTRHELPALAASRDWPVRADHCFQRILLDNAVGGVWYDAIPRRPAYRHADMATLERALDLGRAAIAGTADLHRLNARSLAWRRQAKASASRSSVSVSRA